MWKLAVTFLIAISIFSVPTELRSETSPIWGKLTPGPHPVGFQVLFRKDPSRPFKAKRDYQGNITTADRSRPIQISIWYPAAAGSKSDLIAFEEYLYLTASEQTGIEPTDQQKQNVVTAFKNRWAQGASDQDLQAALKSKMLSLRNATPAKDRFPLVLIAPSSRLSSPVSSVVLAEFLASNGFVVASCPGIGLNSPQLSFDSVGVLTQMQDLQFVIATLNSFPAVDPNKLAVIGFSFGALAGSLLTMYNGDVDAFVSLETSAGNKFGYSLLFQNPLYDPPRMRVPVLHLTSQEKDADSSDAFFKAIKYAPLTVVKLKGMTPGDFSSFTMVSPLIPIPASEPPNQPAADKRPGYETICHYTLEFLNAKVKQDQQAEAFLKQPAQNDLAIVEMREGLKIPPSEEEFMKILREQGLGAAKTIQQETKSKDPDYDIYDPIRLVDFGRELVDQKKSNDAIRILQFNSEVYPDVWETYELMGTIYMNEGNKDLAIQNFEKVLEYDPQNQNAAETLKKLKS
jgi:tetratricopeptide (TPR) repeat protein